MINISLGADTQTTFDKQESPTTQEGKACKSKPLLGVIRWDAFCGGDNTTNPELKSLSPSKYHDRVPFFLRIESENKVSGNENNQKIIDRQIEYAKSGGIGYWAFITPPDLNPDGAESYALDKYLKSNKKADLQFCVIIHKYRDTGWEDRVKALVEMFAEPTYVKVLGNRPLVYIFNIRDMEERYEENTKKHLDMLMSETIASGLERPYVALMNADVNMVRKYGADAVSSYANGSGHGTSYASLATSDRERWEAFRNTGVKVIPLVSLGWNQMPRTDNPPPWGGGGGPYFDRPAPEEAADHIREGFAYVERYPDACDARSILCYAWNEYAEGGWLCPTHADGTKHLDAIRMMIETYKKEP